MTEVNSFGIEPITSHAFNASRNSNLFEKIFDLMIDLLFCVSQKWRFRPTIMRSISTKKTEPNGH